MQVRSLSLASSAYEIIESGALPTIVDLFCSAETAVGSITTSLVDTLTLNRTGPLTLFLIYFRR